MGLSAFINKDTNGQRIPRKPEWNRQNKKALSRLAPRQAAWEKLDADWKAKTTKPGSMKIVGGH